MRTTSNMTLRKRFDWPLIVTVVLSVSALIAAVIPLGCAAKLMHDHHRFIEDLGESLLYARRNGALELTVDGEALPAQMDQAEWVYQLVFDAGVGSPVSKVPSQNGESVSFDFGDGSALQLFPTTIKGSGGTEKAGTIVCYTRADGSIFAYDTDQFAFRDVVTVLTGSAS